MQDAFSTFDKRDETNNERPIFMFYQYMNGNIRYKRFLIRVIFHMNGPAPVQSKTNNHGTWNITIDKN